MRKVNVEIEGTTPLLMNNPQSMIDEQLGERKETTGQKTKSRKQKEKDADVLAYKKKNGELYIPAEAIKGCLLNGASWKKFGKYSAKQVMASAVRIHPEQVGIGKKSYTYDVRTVVIQRNRVVKLRPRIEKWKASFELWWDENLISSPDLVKPILVEAGQRVGLLDFRPQKTGPFGCFEVIKFEVK